MNGLKYMYVKIKIYREKKKKRKKNHKKRTEIQGYSICLSWHVEKEYEKRDEGMGGINDNFIS